MVTSQAHFPTATPACSRPFLLPLLWCQCWSLELAAVSPSSVRLLFCASCQLSWHISATFPPSWLQKAAHSALNCQPQRPGAGCSLSGGVSSGPPANKWWEQEATVWGVDAQPSCWGNALSGTEYSPSLLVWSFHSNHCGHTLFPLIYLKDVSTE